MKRNTATKPTTSNRNVTNFLFALCTAACLLLFGVATVASGQTAPKQKTFATADEAANSLIDAASRFDSTELAELLGPGSYDLVFTGEPVRDRELVNEFVAKAREKTNVSLDRSKRRAVLLIGNDSWPFAIPIAKQGTTWVFDTNAGRQELLYRRIGRNELDAIQICRGFVEAQHAYALTKHDNSQVNQYAQRIISTPGKHDGLAWQNPDGTWGGVVGEKAAYAIEQSYTGQTAPFHGYYFKVLKGQGLAAPLGRMDFVINGVMIGGFALLAFPSQYQVTGVKSFIVSHDGVVYEKDLGPDTLGVARTIELFSPDKTWTPVLQDER